MVDYTFNNEKNLNMPKIEKVFEDLILLTLINYLFKRCTNSTANNVQYCNDSYKASSLNFQEVRSHHVIVITMTSLVLIAFIINIDYFND